MSFGDKRFGKKAFDKDKNGPPKLIIERGFENLDVIDVPYYATEGKRVSLDRAKEILENYLAKVPGAAWSEIKDHLGQILEDFRDSDKTILKKYFEELKKAQALREKIVEKSNPAFNKVALYIHEKLKNNSELSYEDIITSFFAEHLEDPALDDVNDEVLEKLEKVFPKIQDMYKSVS